MKKLFRFALLLIAAPSVAFAQEAPENSVFIAGGVAAVPRYEGADKYQPIPLAIVRANWEHRYLAIEGPSIRANIINESAFEFGPLVNIVLDRSGNLGSVAVEQLATIKVAAEVGAFAGYNVAVSPTSRVRIGIEGSHDVTGIHDGWQARVSLGYSAAPSQRVRISATATANFADAGYARTYFGITAAGSTASGLPGYTPNGGLKDVGLNLAGTYSLSRRWSLTAVGSYRRLLADFADSPIVAREGSSNQFFAGLGLGYVF